MSREFMVSAAMIIAIVAAVLTIVDRSLSLRKRFKIFRRRYAPRKKEWTPPAWVAVLPGWLKNLGPPMSYLFLYEVIIITAAGVLLNYLGLVLSVHLQSVLYLDMMGTAFAAFLLGPWWGAIVALLTNSVVNW
ncbi:MAG: hypothetical protein VST65_04675, partial [Nitrospirota bacterium]|nr:hypothetical protein [Nitrospirota bacterium]